MDNFINIAKQGYQAYQSSQDHGGNSGHGNSPSGGDPNYRQTGGEEYNAPHYPQQGSGHGGYGIDHDEAVRTAGAHGTGDSSMYSSAVSYVNQNQDQHHDAVDEDAVQDAHHQVYEKGAGGNLPASSLGSAAALQVLQKFTSGGGSGGGGGGGSHTQLISMAMAEASKLFDQSGGGGQGGKQDAVNGAAMTVTKLLVQSKFSGLTGGKQSGGLSQLTGLASKFL